jgi:hypothetical protein
MVARLCCCIYEYECLLRPFTTSHILLLCRVCWTYVDCILHMYFLSQRPCCSRSRLTYWFLQNCPFQKSNRQDLIHYLSERNEIYAVHAGGKFPPRQWAANEKNKWSIEKNGGYSSPWRKLPNNVSCHSISPKEGCHRQIDLDKRY